LPDDAFFLFDEHLFELIDNVIVINVTFLFFLTGRFIINEDTIGIVECAFFVSPSSEVVIFKEEIVAFELETNGSSISIELFNKVFPTRVRYSAGLHVKAKGVIKSKYLLKNN
jgi:hypothetical protein